MGSGQPHHLESTNVQQINPILANITVVKNEQVASQYWYSECTASKHIGDINHYG